MDYRTADFAVRKQLAAADDTSTEILKRLAQDQDAQIRRLVAANPNSSEETLQRLSEEFADDVVENPIFNIVLLENPDSMCVRLALARSTKTTSKMLEELAKSNIEEVLCAIAANPNAPLSILEWLIYDPPRLVDYEYAEPGDYDGIYMAMAQNPHLPIDLIGSLLEVCYGTRQALAKHPKTPVEFLEKFSIGADYRMSQALLENRNSSAKIIEYLALSDVLSIREATRNHPNATPQVELLIQFIETDNLIPESWIAEFAKDVRRSVRLKVVRHQYAPSEVLERMIQDQNNDFEILLLACQNSQKTPRTIQEFSEIWPKHYNSHNCDAAMDLLLPWSIDNQAAYPEESTQVMHNIMKLKIRDVMYYQKMLAELPTVPPEVLYTLRDNLRDDNAEDRQRKGLEKIIENPVTPLDLLEQLIADPILDIQEKILTSPIIPSDWLEPWIKHSDPIIRAMVAKHPNATVNMLLLLAEDKSSAVQQVILARENLQENVIRKLYEALITRVLETAPYSEIGGEMRQYPVKTDLQTMGRLIAHPSLPIDLILKLRDRQPKALYEQFGDGFYGSVLSWLAENPAISLQLLRGLQCDVEPSRPNKAAAIWLKRIQNPIMSAADLEYMIENSPRIVLAGNCIFDSSMAGTCNQSSPSRFVDPNVSHPDVLVRMRVAGHPNTSESVLVQLVQDPSSEVRGQLLRRQGKLSLGIIQQLSQDPDPEIAKQARALMDLDGGP